MTNQFPSTFPDWELCIWSCLVIGRHWSYLFCCEKSRLGLDRLEDAFRQPEYIARQLVALGVIESVVRLDRSADRQCNWIFLAFNANLNFQCALRHGEFVFVLWTRLVDNELISADHCQRVQE